MRIDKRKIALIGCGMVGMSYAYCLLNQNVCDELVLIDLNEKKALGEAMDLNHGLAFAASNMEIYPGNYSDCQDADMVVICAGAETRGKPPGFVKAQCPGFPLHRRAGDQKRV